MSKNFVTMKSNCGTNIQDTTAPMATILGVYINNRYFDILRRTNFQTIVDPYAISVTAGDNKYDLAATFGKELFVQDTTNKTQLTYLTLQDWIDLYKTDPTATGVSTNYTIVDYMSSASPALRTKEIRLYPIPSANTTLNAPYIIRPVALSATTDETIIDCEDAIELGATADALRYKRQHGKAQDYEMLYEKSIAMLIWDKENQPAQPHLFSPATFNKDNLI
jgi:hypothetical protein